MSGSSFVKGAVLLSAASLAAKVLNAVFKIPLDRLFIGAEGIALYQNANNIYNWILAIAATGIPLTVSNLVAHSSEEEAAEIRSSALWSVTAVSAAIGFFLFIFAGSIATRISGSELAPASPAIQVMSFAVFFSGISGAYKGYFQGRGNMLPSALAQIADSLCKAFVGLGVCAVLISRGCGIELASAGAMSGVVAGSATGAIILLLAGKKSIRVHRPPRLSTAKKVLLAAVPMTLGAAGFSCMMMADNFTVQSLLLSAGSSLSESTELFGHLSRAFMIYNLPATLIAAVTLSVAPACAEAEGLGSRDTVLENTSSAVKMVMLISIPCTLGCLGFSKEILLLLYGSSAHNELLMLTGFLMLLIPLTQVLSAILQATGCVWEPVLLLGATVLTKLLLNLALVPRLGVAGAPLSSVIAYVISSIALIILFRRKKGSPFTAGALIKPLTAGYAGLVCGRLLHSRIGGVFGFLCGAGAMAACYVLLCVLLGAVNKSDFKR